jgi:hypothetical protein
MISVAVLILAWPLITRVWFTALLGSVSKSVQAAEREWNRRAPKGVMFRVVTSGDFFQPGQVINSYF